MAMSEADVTQSVRLYCGTLKVNENGSLSFESLGRFSIFTFHSNQAVSFAV